jgi:hypothetical protein
MGRSPSGQQNRHILRDTLFQLRRCPSLSVQRLLRLVQRWAYSFYRLKGVRPIVKWPLCAMYSGMFVARSSAPAPALSPVQAGK